MRTLRIPNPILTSNEKTYLGVDYIAGQNTTISGNPASLLTTISTFSFSTYNVAVTLVLGNVGEKNTEASTYVANNSNPPYYALWVQPTLFFSHAKGTIIYQSNWDSVSIEGQVGASGWNVIQQTPIQWDKPQTLYVHTPGDDTWSYRFRFVNTINSQNPVFSEYSPTLTGAGFARNMVGRMVLNTRKRLRDPNRERYSDNDIIDLFNDAQFDICTLIPKLWFLYVDTWETASPTFNGPLNSIGLGMTANTNQTKYALNAFPDLDSLDKIRYYYNNTGSFLLYDLQPLAYTDFDRFMFNQNRIKSDIVLSFKIVPPDNNSSQGYFEVDPINVSGNIGTFFPVYWRKPKTLVEMTDITDILFPDLLEDYAAWKLHDWSGNSAEAAKYKDLYYGPSDETPIESASGIKLLTMYNNKIRRANAAGRSLWNWRGARSRNNFFGDGVVNRDFIRENYL